MKILKHGDLKLRKFTCDDCGCEFVADKTEYEIYEFQAPKNLITTYMVICPDCSLPISVHGDEAPLYEGSYYAGLTPSTYVENVKRYLEFIEEQKDESKTNS